MHVSGIQRLVRQRDRAAAVEGALIAGHAALYLTVVLWVLSPLRALVFVVVQQAIFSVYLGISFAPNHKGMPVIECATEMSFAERQVITARNITGGRLISLLLGGLNYQIEHHLFPTMPRPNLPRLNALSASSASAMTSDTVRTVSSAPTKPSLDLSPSCAPDESQRPENPPICESLASCCTRLLDGLPMSPVHAGSESACTVHGNSS